MVQKDAPAEEIEAAYKRLIRAYHPDANLGGRQDLASEMTKRLNEARDTLPDPEARGEYDARLASGPEDEETEEADLSPEEAAAADEAWQDELRQAEAEKAEEPGGQAPQPRTIHWSAFRRLWPQRAPFWRRYFGGMRFAWNVIRGIGSPRSVTDVLLALAVIVFLPAAGFSVDSALLPLIWFYLWWLPYEDVLLFPIGMVLFVFIGAPLLPLLEWHHPGWYAATPTMTAFVHGYPWLAHLNARLLAVDGLARALHASIHPAIAFVLGPWLQRQQHPYLAYGLTTLATLAIPYRVWQLVRWLAKGRVLERIGGWVGPLRERLRAKGTALAEVRRTR